MIYLTKLIESSVVGMPVSSKPLAGTKPVGQQPPQPQQEIQQPDRLSIEEKRQLLELTKKINHFSKSVYREGNILEVAESLQQITSLSERYMVNECGDMLEANTAKRNIQEMKKYCDSFVKLANEIHNKQRQMEALFEDYSRVVERYYDIDEVNDVVPTTKSVNEQDPSLKDPRTIKV